MELFEEREGGVGRGYFFVWKVLVKIYSREGKNKIIRISFFKFSLCMIIY